jgi:hypothetical protein
MTSFKTMSKKRNWKKEVKNLFFGTFFFSPLGNLNHVAVYKSSLKIHKNEFTIHFEQKFSASSYGVGIQRA